MTEQSLKTELVKPGLQESDRERIQWQIEKLTTDGDQDKLRESTNLGLSDPEIIKLAGSKDNSQRAADYKIQEEQQRAAQQRKKLEERDLKTDVREAGQQGLGEVESLGASKQQIEQARSALTQMDKGHAEGAEQLLGVLASFSHTVDRMTDAQGKAYDEIVRRLQDVERKLKDGLTAHAGVLRALSVSMNS